MRIGVISDLSHTASPAYSSYYYALVNLHYDVKLVHGISDLNGIDVLVYGNDHHAGHLNIWSDDKFTEECNKRRIPFFAHTVEHIRSPSYPWNLDIQEKLKRYTYLRQRCWDIGDAKEQGTKLARVLLSRNFQNFTASATQVDELIFIDGSEFTGYSEFMLVRDKARVILIDDVHHAFKCFQIYDELIKSSQWICLTDAPGWRNGFAVFEKKI